MILFRDSAGSLQPVGYQFDQVSRRVRIVASEASRASQELTRIPYLNRATKRCDSSVVWHATSSVLSSSMRAAMNSLSASPSVLPCLRSAFLALRSTSAQTGMFDMVHPCSQDAEYD